MKKKKEKIDLDKARTVLQETFAIVKKSGFFPIHPKTMQITEVMHSDSKTYRYILITNLLAKSTNPSIHALALQAGSDLPGAFDGRSLCHTVVVPADRDKNLFDGFLGGSNEPYLNKPARAKNLSLSNPVRSGRNKKILENCIDILGSLVGENDAKEALQVAVHCAINSKGPKTSSPSEIRKEDTSFIIIDFCAKTIKSSYGGECCILFAGLCFYLLGIGGDQAYDIRVHPANQPGTSSKQVLDIDIYFSNSLRYSAEVKDRKFSIQDVEHAAKKAEKAGLDCFFFIVGPQAEGQIELKKIINTASTAGISVVVLELYQLLKMCVGYAAPNATSEGVWCFLEKIMCDANIKGETRAFVVEEAINSGLRQSESKS